MKILSLHRFSEVIFENTEFFFSDKSFKQTKMLRELSTAIELWVNDREESTFSHAAGLLGLDYIDDETKNKIRTISPDPFESLPRLTSSISEYDAITALFHLIIWATISVQNKAAILKLVNEMKHHAKHDGGQIEIVYFCCLYHCSFWLARLQSAKLGPSHNDDKNKIVLLCLGEPLTAVSRFISNYFTLSTKKNGFRLNIRKARPWEHELLFFTASFLSFVFGKIEKTQPTTKEEKELFDQLRGNANWNGRCNILSCHTTAYFFDFQVLWFYRPVFYEYLVSITREQLQSVGSRVKQGIAHDDVREHQSYKERAKLRGDDNADQQPEDDVDLVDTDGPKSKFIDYEAKEGSDEDSKSEQSMTKESENSDSEEELFQNAKKKKKTSIIEDSSDDEEEKIDENTPESEEEDIKKVAEEKIDENTSESEEEVEYQRPFTVMPQKEYIKRWREEEEAKRKAEERRISDRTIASGNAAEDVNQTEAQNAAENKNVNATKAKTNSDKEGHGYEA